MYIAKIDQSKQSSVIKRIGRGRRVMSCSMGSSSRCFNVLLIIMSLMVLSLSADAYKNYTVGESKGWFDIQERPSVNYQKWADSKSFSLGDFLVFNTDSNHSVVQTYDFKTYKSCDYNNNEDNSTREWSAAKPSAKSPVPVTVKVPLVKEGSNYFFSGNYDGEQCKFGQHFMINVTHGQGLPAPDEDEETAPGPSQSSQSGGGDDEVAPDTIVPANFDHPKDIESDDEDSSVKGRKNSSSMIKYNSLCLVLVGFLASFF